MKRVLAPIALVLAAAPMALTSMPVAAQQDQSDLARVNA
jgi:hypothetical protein